MNAHFKDYNNADVTIKMPRGIVKDFQWLEYVNLKNTSKNVAIDCSAVINFNSFGSKVFFQDHPMFKVKPILFDVPEAILRDMIAWRMLEIPFRIQSITPRYQCENGHGLSVTLTVSTVEDMESKAPKVCPECGEPLELDSMTSEHDFYKYFTDFKP